MVVHQTCGGERICACGGEQVIERLIEGEKIELDSHISRKSCTEISRVDTRRRARNSGAQADLRPYPADPPPAGLTPAIY